MRGVLPTRIITRSTRTPTTTSIERQCRLREDHASRVSSGLSEVRALSECRGDSDQELDRVWREYKQTGSAALRNYLIIHYMGGHVRRIAQRLHAQLPPQVEVDDLIDEAYEGLVDVIDRFDLEKDVRFETYSSKRIFGAMRDYLRKIDPIPRLARTRSKQAQALIEGFQKKHGRGPDTEELSRLLRLAAVARFRKSVGRDPDDDEHRRLIKLADTSFRKLMIEGRPAMMVSFNGGGGGSGGSSAGDSRRSVRGGNAAHGLHAHSGGGDEADAMASFEDRRRPSPLGRAELNDLRRWITDGFSRRDRLIIVLYYYEQMTMKEVGRTLGCSESRVSQRLESILDCLRARLHRTGSVIEFYRK